MTRASQHLLQRAFAAARANTPCQVLIAHLRPETRLRIAAAARSSPVCADSSAAAGCPAIIDSGSRTWHRAGDTEAAILVQQSGHQPHLDADFKLSDDDLDAFGLEIIRDMQGGGDMRA
jgi:hypothetical protein